jgi:hypothetical protein
MRPGRIIAIIVGALFALASVGLLIAGGVLTIAYAAESEDGGYFDETLDRIGTTTAAIITGDIDLRVDPGPDWFFETVDVTVRLQATAVNEDASLFVGIGPTADVDTYLIGVARDEIEDVSANGRVRYSGAPGADQATPPVEEDFWVASAAGAGTQTIEWDVAEGEWVVVLMNSDGSAGILADVTVGVRSGALLAIGVSMLAVGGVLLIIAVAIILAGALGRGTGKDAATTHEEGAEGVLATMYSARLSASLDTPLSQWLWLVKWFLAIPHFIVLALLWIAYVVLTFVAGVAILFTGRYPRGIFDFNVGVMRWTWRVVFYAGSGGLGTDRYPPFTLDSEADYPATLDVAYPDQLSRGLVLVKWWLLAIPHYLVLVFIVGGGVGWWWGSSGAIWSGGLLGLLVLIAAVTLLFTGQYPKSLFDLIIGLNRWVFRVAAYAGLMTDQYPPFRLDQGPTEPTSGRAPNSLERS